MLEAALDYQLEPVTIHLQDGSLPERTRSNGAHALLAYEEPASWFDQRDESKAILAGHLTSRPSQDWLEVLEGADIWCAEVLDWDTLTAHPQFQLLEIVQTVEAGSGATYETTVCPIRIDGRKPTSPLGSNALGEHNARIDEAYDLR